MLDSLRRFVLEVANLSIYKDESTDAEAALMAMRFVILKARGILRAG